MSTIDGIPFRPLGIIKSVLEQTGFSISHCYEDLVFVNHNAFLLRMESKGSEISLLFNVDSDEDKRRAIASQLNRHGNDSKLNIAQRGLYRLVPDEKSQTIAIEFMEDRC